jgi:hypothetical protein
MAEVTLTVQIEENLQRQAEAVAEMRGETLSKVVESALEDYVKKSSKRKVDPQWALKNDPLLSLRFSGGPGDVAGRVEEILLEAADPETGLSLDNDRTD